jgi:hypothetical protein
MRDRLTEWLPLLLVGVLLIVFQISRSGWLTSALQPPVDASPTTLRAAATPTSKSPLVVASARATPPPVSALCQPRFLNGLAALKTALGATMGDPLDCEHPVDNAGNTQQRTTMGLAYYRKALDAACFTTGWDHWALTGPGRLMHWTGDAVDPPADAAPVAR